MTRIPVLESAGEFVMEAALENEFFYYEMLSDNVLSITENNETA